MASLRILTFNIWRNGGRSLALTIAAIRRSDADIVLLQECNGQTADAIAGALGAGAVTDETGLAVLTRHRIARAIGRTEEPWGGLGATLALAGGRRVHAFDAHLHWDRYGPYFLKERRSPPVILAEERATRMPGLEELLRMMDPLLASGEPCFLGGDFNAPSHLDYDSFPWPESLACEARGLSDAYREAHPSARRYPGPFAFDEPGITWTPLVDEEPHGAFDRIDFVYHAPAAGTRVTAAIALDGRNGGVDPWPSDHRAVLATFELPEG